MAEITKFSTSKNNVDIVQLSRSNNPNFESLDLKKLQKDLGKKIFVINACARGYQYKGDLPDDLIFWDYNYGHDFHVNRFNQSNIQYIDGIELLKSQALHALHFWGIPL
jgi:shikimate 5-dehydrogenase